MRDYGVVFYRNFVWLAAHLSLCAAKLREQTLTAGRATLGLNDGHHFLAN